MIINFLIVENVSSFFIYQYKPKIIESQLTIS